MTVRTPGRHRGADVSPATLFVEAVSHHTAPIAKAAATTAVTTGMVAVAAFPTQAAHAAPAPLADPATTTSSLPILTPAAITPAVAPAVTTPVVTARATATTFGEMDFVGVEAPVVEAPASRDRAAEAAPRRAVRSEESTRLRRLAARATETAAASDDAHTTRVVSSSRMSARQSLRDRTAEQSDRQAAPTPQSTRDRSVDDTRSPSRDGASPSGDSGTDSAARGDNSSSPKTSDTPAEDAPRRSTGGVLGAAAAYSGIYYVYGGTTPAGFDCSGFTQFVFGRAGVSLPRTAEAQRQATTSVSNPQPGDLVFFGAPAYHVGIYAGDGMMYDSPRTGKASGLHKIWSSNVSYGRA